MSKAGGKATLLVIILNALRKIPVWVCVPVGRSLGWLVSWVPTKTRGRVEQNMKTVLRFRDESFSSTDIQKLARRAFSSYGRYYAEAATLPGTPRATILKSIEWESGEDLLREEWERGNGVILALPHVGSWEWGGSMLGLTMTPLVAAAELLEPPELFTWFKEGRERIGIEVEALDAGVGNRLMKHLRNGRVVGLLCDRDITSDGIEVDLLGVSTTMPAGPAMLALRSGASLLCGVVYSGPGASHRAKVVGPIDTQRQGSLRTDIARVSQDIANTLSQLIATAPEQWHVFAEVIGAARET